MLRAYVIRLDMFTIDGLITRWLNNGKMGWVYEKLFIFVHHLTVDASAVGAGRVFVGWGAAVGRSLPVALDIVYS